MNPTVARFNGVNGLVLRMVDAPGLLTFMA